MNWDALISHARTWGLDQSRRTFADGKGGTVDRDPPAIPDLVKAAMGRVTTYARICDFAAGVDPKNELRWVRRDFIGEHVKLDKLAKRRAAVQPGTP